jgi:hypothetical protein
MVAVYLAWLGGGNPSGGTLFPQECATMTLELLSVAAEYRRNAACVRIFKPIRHTCVVKASLICR